MRNRAMTGGDIVTSPLDAVDRETAWLSTTGDGLPELLKINGGPFDNVQAYWARVPRTQQHTIFVTRSDMQDERTANIRTMIRHSFVLRITWPVLAGTGHAETDQRNLDAAIILIIGRIRGFVGDKTHGGAFLSVAENPRYVRVTFDPAEATIPGAKELRASVAYMADDEEING
jgi:hypothetical protein